VPTYQTQILGYISNHFRDAHPEAFKKDVETLAGLRRDWVEARADIHPEIVRGLMRYVVLRFQWQKGILGLNSRYHAQLTFLATKFPSNVRIFFAIDKRYKADM